MSWLAQGFEGAKAGRYFGMGQFGLGYYTDIMARSADASDTDADSHTGVISRQQVCARPFDGNSVGQRHEQERAAALACTSETEEVGSSAAGAAEILKEKADRPVMGDRQQHDCATAAAVQLASATDADGNACTTSRASPEESSVEGEARGSPAHAQQRPQHYWGQALQYLEKSADVTKGRPPDQSIPAHAVLFFWACSCKSLGTK